MKFQRSYINLRGQKIWASQAKPLFGSKEKVVLLHGGMSQSEGFDGRLLPSVKGFHVYSYDRAGHGRTPDQTGSFHFDFQNQEAIAFLEDVVKEPAHLIGFSDGGIIALLVAINRPDLVKTITLVGANYHHGGVSIEPWVPGDAEKAKYAAFSPDGAETLIKKIKKMAKIWSTEPNMTKKQLKSIKCPALVIAGDDDVVDLKHTKEIYEAIENSRLAIIPGASHSIDKDQPVLLNKIIRDFLLNHEYPVTSRPERRKMREAQ
ncbi:MAG: alpha/beta fold hydrolase [Candidatus Nanopelagicaceae bacterium]